MDNFEGVSNLMIYFTVFLVGFKRLSSLKYNLEQNLILRYAQSLYSQQKVLLESQRKTNNKD